MQKIRRRKLARDNGEMTAIACAKNRYARRGSVVYVPYVSRLSLDIVNDRCRVVSRNAKRHRRWDVVFLARTFLHSIECRACRGIYVRPGDPTNRRERESRNLCSHVEGFSSTLTTRRSISASGNARGTLISEMIKLPRDRFVRIQAIYLYRVARCSINV